MGGLTQLEASARLEKYGPNVLARANGRSKYGMLLSYFKSPLVIILILAGSISAFVGEFVNASIIYVVVAISVILGFYQESKAENAAAVLRKKIMTTVTVHRDGNKEEIPVSEVVPGDLVYLSAGDIVPADGKVIEAKDLFVDQAALTGESFPADKEPGLEPESSVDTSSKSLVFMGTSVVGGAGAISVTKTGSSTEFGKIAKQLVGKTPETEFDRGLRKYALLIMQVTLLLVIFVFFINAMLKRNILESLLFSVALAVGLTPELLPMIVTINLSNGAMNMSKKGVIVRKLATIQNFGSMDILCTDKTGTLTENAITMTSYVDIDGRPDDQIALLAQVNSSLQSGMHTPLDEAIMKDARPDAAKYTKVDEIPFDFVRRRTSVIAAKDQGCILICKGALLEVLVVCRSYANNGQTLSLTDAAKSKILARYEEQSRQGIRILAVARKAIEKKGSYGVEDEKELEYVGLLAFSDPPKQSASSSVKLLADSGVALKILTGDNEFVAKHVCDQLGIDTKGIMTGDDLRQVSDSALAVIVERTTIFARVTPDQKNRIMTALRKNGHVVGFMGDGINDAASIRTADVGISVNNAVDVAKAAADIVLLEKDLTVLARGVHEGRKTLGNTMKYIMMGTSSNFGNMFSAAGASVFLTFLPMLPSQILVNNLLYDISEMAIPTDHVDSEYLMTPHKWDVTFVKRFMLFFGPVSSLFDFLTFGVMLFVFSATPALFQTAWFLESISTQSLVIFVIRTRRVPFYKSRPSRSLTASTLAVVATAMLLPFTPAGPLLGFVIPPTSFYFVLAGFVGSYLGLVELLKYGFYKGRMKQGHNKRLAASRKVQLGAIEVEG